MSTERALEPKIPDTKRMTRGLVYVVIASVVLYGAFALSADAGNVLEALRRFPPWILGAAMSLSFANYLVRFVRWRMYCARLSIELEPKTSFLIHLSGLALTVSPGKMGEAFKSLLVRRITGVPVAVSAPIVLAERFTDLLAFLVLIAIGASASESGQSWIVWSTSALCASLFAFVVSTRLQRVFVRTLASSKAGSRFVPKIEEALASSRTLLAPSGLILPTLIATAGWSLECFAFQLVAGAFVDGGVPFLFAAYTFALAAVAGAVAFIFPGGLGVTEASMGGLLRRRYVASGLGVEAAAASAVSATILIRLATLWFAVLVGVVAVLLFKRRHGGLT
ncbi:MAG: lysylphosphatidylglycerol synthase transmembrane domain-containing protein [Planctomycetota bacterium]|nr:lysylphosphatidylglycerol synthase transmembrane domain-containing protein [Planctomycetota bacterium]